jgi:hypothetical protein
VGLRRVLWRVGSAKWTCDEVTVRIEFEKVGERKGMIDTIEERDEANLPRNPSRLFRNRPNSGFDALEQLHTCSPPRAAEHT